MKEANGVIFTLY